jgi:hypothetical protein
MANILMIPASGAIIFDSQSPNFSGISPLSAAPRLSYDNAGGLNISSYTTGESFLDRFTVDGSYGRLFGVSDSVTGVVFSVNDAAGLPIVEVESNFTDKITMGTYGSNALVVNDNKIGIGNPAPTAKLDIAETWNSNITVTGASGTGSIATITFAAQSAAIVVGSTIVVAGINPAGYNGTFVVTASTTTSVSYANATTVDRVSGGTIQQLFTSVKVNATDTASNAGSLLLDLQTGGASKFKITKNGVVQVGSGTNRPILFDANGGIGINRADTSLTTATVYLGNVGGGPRITVINTGTIGFSPSSTDASGGNANPETSLSTDGNGILAQRKIGTAQTFRVYNDTDATPATNFDRATFGWTSNVLRIGTEKGGSYTDNRGIDFILGGTTVLRMLESNNISSICTFSIAKIMVAGAALGSTEVGVSVPNAHKGIVLNSTSVTCDNLLEANANGKTVKITNNGTFVQQPLASVIPASNGDFVVEATSNTSLTLRLKGSDGVVRSVSLTLA